MIWMFISGVCEVCEADLGIDGMRGCDWIFFLLRRCLFGRRTWGGVGRGNSRLTLGLVELSFLALATRERKERETIFLLDIPDVIF